MTAFHIQLVNILSRIPRTWWETNFHIP